MPRCDLLNAIFAKQHRHLWLLAFPNMKFAAFIERAEAKSVSFTRLRPWYPDQGLWPWTPLRLFVAHNNWIEWSTFGPHTKNIVFRALALATFLVGPPFSFKFLAQPMNYFQFSFVRLFSRLKIVAISHVGPGPLKALRRLWEQDDSRRSEILGLHYTVRPDNKATKKLHW